MDRSSRCNKVDAVRLYASNRLNLLLPKGQRCVSCITIIDILLCDHHTQSLWPHLFFVQPQMKLHSLGFLPAFLFKLIIYFIWTLWTTYWSLHFSLTLTYLFGHPVYRRGGGSRLICGFRRSRIEGGGLDTGGIWILFKLIELYTIWILSCIISAGDQSMMRVVPIPLTYWNIWFVCASDC